jgi:uncharacterized protein YkwD
MRRFVRLSATIAVAAAFAGLVPGTPAVAAGGGRYKDRHAMFVATNDSRQTHDRKRVAIDREISRIAKHHSAWMARTGKLVHTKDPGGAYLKGVNWRCWGENIAVSGQTVPEIEKAFMQSPDHRANILNTCFRHVAIGTVRDDAGALWVTVFFYG